MPMKRCLLQGLFLLISISTFGQFPLKPLDVSDPSLPAWAKLMYSKNPNVFEVDEARENYIKLHPTEKEFPYDAYYKHWKRFTMPFVKEDGSIHIPTDKDKAAFNKLRNEKSTTSKLLSPWTFCGPERHLRARYNAADPVVQISWHANTYCIDQSLTNPNILFAGGENGGVYKSVDKGLNWQYVSLNYEMTTVSSVAINPANELDVLVNADNQTYRSIDGGGTWTSVDPTFQNKNVWQFTYNPINAQVVFAGTQDGLYKSVDAGTTWTLVYAGECQSVVLNPLNPNFVYALRYDAVSKIAQFYKSIDGGSTFTIKPTGWFTVPPADAGLIQSYGGRIAVTEADTSRIYVLLVGESQAAANLQTHGLIGVYRSDDGGESWTHPHGLIGAPYNQATHPNMMTFSGDNGTYNQIYYNTALVVSQLDPDKILIGGLSLWKSVDGAVSYQPVGGYVGNVGNIHPDNQELKIYKTSPTTEEVWIANDGGINYSTDFVQTHDSRCNGLLGSAFWGFDQGWNDDIMVGGRYHNGNAARRDGYPAGSYQQLGGGEAPTGYVNYSNEKKTYYSDIDGKILPDSLNGIVRNFPVAENPNESYVDNSSSRIMFDWDYWNVAYLGKDNKIYKSINGGSSYGELFSFGTNTSAKVYWMEQSRANTNVMYAQQVVSNVSRLWKSIDRGISWTLVTLPQNRRELNFTLSYNSADELWISYPTGANGNKVYRTINGGASWTNITTADLDGLEIKSMAHQFGTDGGVYLGTFHGPVFYRNNTLTTWATVGTNLPFISYPLRLVPFYRNNKLRLATWHLGIWENQLYENSNLVADFSADYKTFYCPGDTISFVPHSVASATATYQWSFPGGNPATSTDTYPKVVFGSIGSFDITLIVNDNGNADTITKAAFIQTSNNGTLPFQEDFEAGQFDNLWKLKGTGTAASNWSISNTIGGFGASTHCMFYDNYNYDALGAHDAVWTAKYDLTNMQSGWLTFDVAYARYNATYSDSLEVLASTDCGQTFTSLYLKGGAGIATAPQNSSAAFVPTASQWRTDSVNISALVGNSEVLFSFENIGRFGQVMYVDNINLSTLTTNVNEVTKNIEFDVYPNPFEEELHFKTELKDPLKLYMYDASMRRILVQNFVGSSIVNAKEFAEGSYFYEIRSAKGIVKTGKLIKR